MAKGRRRLKQPGQGATLPAEPRDVDVAQLAAAMRADRVARRLTWPQYSDFLGVPLATVYKLATGRTTKPHELTVAQIRDTMAAHPVKAKTKPRTEGAGREVVSDGQ